jgi:hypothetical protein
VPDLTPLDIQAQLTKLTNRLTQSQYSRADFRTDLLVLAREIEARFVDTSQACVVPCASEPLSSGVVAEDVLGKLCLTIWEHGGTEPDGASDTAGAILTPEDAMLLGRWLCNWAGTRLTEHEEVANARP